MEIDHPKIREFLQAVGLDPDNLPPDTTQDLSALPEGEWVEYARITPPAAILRYLESGDTLSHQTIDLMETAIEKAYKLPPTWCITSLRNGTEENGDLAVEYFYLLRDPQP